MEGVRALDVIFELSEPAGDCACRILKLFFHLIELLCCRVLHLIELLCRRVLHLIELLYSRCRRNSRRFPCHLRCLFRSVY